MSGPRIYVDADACPVKEEVCRVARRHGLPVVMVANRPMRVPEGPHVRLEVVAAGRYDEADDWIATQAGKDDIVITGDIPLAARCLAAGAHVLGPAGRPFTRSSIGEALATREVLNQMRDAGVMVGGPAPFGKQDRSRFLQALEGLVRNIQRGPRAYVDPAAED